MSAAATPAKAAPPATPAPQRKRKKLVIGVAAGAFLLLAGGGGAAYYVQSGGDATPQAVDGDVAPPRATKKHDEKRHTPVFLPLDSFTVNLADRDTERYAQIGITLELSDSKTSDMLKVYMPAIRNDILMLLAHKKVAELQEREGKLTLAREIRRAALKPLGTGPAAKEAPDADEGLPVRAVHFSSFIVQ